MTLMAWTYHAWARKQANQAQLRRLSSAIAPTAEAQVGRGCYGGPGGKLDAAHLMNTTIRSDVLAAGQQLTPGQQAALGDLRTYSAATSMQLKSNNVGPDKVIDMQMTLFTQECARKGDRGEPVMRAEQAVKWLGNMCLQALQGNSGQADYQGAIAGVQDAMRSEGDIMYIQDDVNLWAKKNGFD